MVFHSLNSLFCQIPSSPLVAGGDAQERRQKDRPGSWPQPGPQEADAGAMISGGSPCFQAQPNGPDGPPPSKAHCASCPLGENRTRGLCPACPSPPAHLHGIYTGSCLDAHGFLLPWPLPAPLWRQRSVFCPSSLLPKGPSGHLEHRHRKEGSYPERAETSLEVTQQSRQGQDLNPHFLYLLLLEPTPSSLSSTVG